MSEQINIDELERLAKAATPGPWSQSGFRVTAKELGYDRVADTEFDNDSMAENAAFIAAANPAAVLTLISQLRAVGDRAMHLERRLSDANGEVLRLQGADQHAQRLQAGHDEAVMRVQVLERNLRDAEEAGRRLAKQALQAEQDVERLRQVCSEAYQLAGALDAPVEALDNLAAAMTGQPLPHASFLPVIVSVTDAVRRAEDAEQLATARGHTIQSLQRELSAVKVEAAQKQGRYPDLTCVISWLEAGCDPQDAAKELRLYQAAIEARAVPAEPVNARLLTAAKTVLSFTHVECRPPVRDEFEYGRMTTVRVHALADLYEAVQAADPQCLPVAGDPLKSMDDVNRAIQRSLDELLDEEAQQAEPVNALLLDIATGKLSHLYAGLCPDSSSGTLSRDPECPACRAIAAAEAQQAEPVRLTEEELEGFVRWYGERPDIFFNRREYARTIQDEVLCANGFKVEG